MPSLAPPLRCPMQQPGRHGPPARGFTYLSLLVVLALMGAALAALGSQVSTLAQRDREQELLFRGAQIRDAIGRFRAAALPTRYPSSLDELLTDERGPLPLHHLRQRYADPFTGQPDWVLLRDEAGTGIRGVHSASQQPRMRRTDPPDGVGLAENNALPTVADWLFIHQPEPAPRRPAHDTTP